MRQSMTTKGQDMTDALTAEIAGLRASIRSLEQTPHPTHSKKMQIKMCEQRIEEITKQIEGNA